MVLDKTVYSIAKSATDTLISACETGSGARSISHLFADFPSLSSNQATLTLKFGNYLRNIIFSQAHKSPCPLMATPLEHVLQHLKDIPPTLLWSILIFILFYTYELCLDKFLETFSHPLLHRLSEFEEYLKGTALYFAASFSAPLNPYNFGILKFIGFLADYVRFAQGVKDLCKKVELPRTFKMTMDFSESWHGLILE
ncbi:hypothetical protein NQ317_019728 [Molorchus minor]|uniref:Uncharacterized protein n=1 Tax=Molorchus minor TaxID=1323400 RepID=A0ABQ9J172_9CUCU|nr:hypothetical protein NQ317_019728 [Molorchus minor]